MCLIKASCTRGNMSKFLLGAALVFTIVWATPAQACEDCSEYFDWQANDWCTFCQENTDCGFFRCWIREWPAAGGGTADVCGGDDEGCYIVGRACVQEPRMRLTPRLNDTWRLARVRVDQPGNLRKLPTTRPTAVKKTAARHS